LESDFEELWEEELLELVEWVFDDDVDEELELDPELGEEPDVESDDRRYLFSAVATSRASESGEMCDFRWLVWWEWWIFLLASAKAELLVEINDTIKGPVSAR